MKIKETTYQLNPIAVWNKKLPSDIFPGLDSMNFFDQSGYALCDLEQYHN